VKKALGKRIFLFQTPFKPLFQAVPTSPEP